MSRQSIRLRVDGDVLRRLIKDRETFSDRAQKFGISKQALNEWMVEGLMPPRAIAEFLMDINASTEDTNALLEPQRKSMTEKKKWTVTLTVEES